MTDEENKVIDLLKNIDKQKCTMLECPVVKNNIERQLKIIELNRTIRKQSKEIEELKETLKCTQNSWYEDTQKIEEMKKQIDLDNECEIALNSKVMDLEKEIEELTLDLEEMTKSNNHKKENWVHKSILNSYISKDKIKAKIEEYKESGSVDGTNDILITEMQSLLEKE